MNFCLDPSLSLLRKLSLSTGSKIPEHMQLADVFELNRIATLRGMLRVSSDCRA